VINCGFSAVASIVRDDFAFTSWAVAYLQSSGQGRFIEVLCKFKGYTKAHKWLWKGRKWSETPILLRKASLLT
jgi:hypothetical protein